MKKIKGLFIKTTIVVLAAGAWLAACRREIVAHPGGTDPRAVLPSGQYSIIYTDTPTNSIDDVPVELGVKFKSIVGGNITKISFFKTANDTGTHIGHLWTAGGTLLRTVTFTSESSHGWQFATLSTAYPVTADSVYVVSVNAPHGYAYKHNGFATVITNGPLASIADGNNGVYSSPGSFPTSSSENTNYYRDIVFEPTTDEPTFGADRHTLLNWTLTGSPDLAFVIKQENKITGYCLGREGHSFTQIGPIVTHDISIAKTLLLTTLTHSNKKPLILDIPRHTPEWHAWLTSIGFTEQRPFIRMYRGSNTSRGIPEKQFAILGPEFG